MKKVRILVSSFAGVFTLAVTLVVVQVTHWNGAGMASGGNGWNKAPSIATGANGWEKQSGSSVANGPRPGGSPQQLANGQRPGGSLSLLAESKGGKTPRSQPNGWSRGV